MVKVLLVEDDKNIIETLTMFLNSEGFAVDSASGQRSAIDKIENESYDIALLDVSLSDGNGFAVCSAIKAVGDTPVIFLTASDDEYSVVAGLDMGADDYIIKPFRPRELVSRIKNAIRKNVRSGCVIEYGGVAVNTVKGTVTKNGGEIFLSALEYRMLLTFFNNKGAVLSRARLLEEIWDAGGDFVNDNTLTVYIKRLREKIEDDPQSPKIIRTVRGLGYKVGE